ncbi:YaaR family protein [Bacillus sp. 03113]|uniref:YaaR family protein n=1 Tax=Bacillus sp. 03113 TaxID=2578211 RepID=UPI0011444140|nr:YaaR family protein [Bacillus sp. 03113]
MKINQELRLNRNKVIHDSKNVVHDRLKFQELVQKQDQKLQMTQLQQLLNAIDDAGERLSRSRTFKDLSKYKTLVQRFIKETVDFGMNLKQSNSWNQLGQGRTLKMVETIDQKLIELTEEIINKEKKSLNLLEQVGEIKGLLVNLYT